jgi:hypothetical protein
MDHQQGMCMNVLHLLCCISISLFISQATIPTCQNKERKKTEEAKAILSDAKST